MTRFLLILFVCTICLLETGCNQNFEKQIASKIEESCKESKTCSIDINSITDFSWDKMYVFKYTATKEEIRKTLNVDISFREFTRKIIFMNAGTVVAHDYNTVDIEGIEDGEVIFWMPDSLNYQVYTPGNAQFSASIGERNGKKYYMLSGQ